MRRLASILSATVLVGCGFDDRVAGGTSSEVPNALHGTVLNDSGKPVAGCAVRLAPGSSSFDSTGSVDTTVTDSAGHWTLPRRASTESVAILFRTASGASLARLTLDTSGLASVRTDTLKRHSWVKGQLIGARGLSKVGLLGTNLHVVTDSSGKFVLGPLPAGRLHLLLKADSAGTTVKQLDTLVTNPGDTVTMGNRTIAVNTLNGTVVNESGKPVAGCAVRLAPGTSSFESIGSVDSTVTDSVGHWTLPRRTQTESVAILFQSVSGASLARLTLDSFGLSPLRTDTLKRSTWVKGRLIGAKGLPKIGLRGTGLYTTTDSTGKFLLGPLPAGRLPLLVKADSATTTLRRTDTLVTNSGDTVVMGARMIAPIAWALEDYGAWDHSRSATVDMTTAGANSTGDHVGFPVPVRLDTLIDFRTVKAGELRFDDGKGTRYPYQIEQWDSAAGKALAWVRLDTANGSSSKHDLRMFWGMAGAKAPVDMPLVFNASNGFLAAWHQGSAIDTSLGMTLSWSGSTSGPGILGTAQTISGTGSYATDSVSLGGTRSWTISLWVRLDKKPSGEILLAGFTDGPDSTHWGLSVRDDQVVRVWSGADTSRSLETPTANALKLGVWTHLAATFEDSTERIGLVIDTTAFNRRVVTFPAASRQRLRGASKLTGSLDEIRLVNTERAVEWPALERQTGAESVPWLKWK